MLIENTNIFRDELAPGERLIWTGHPRQGIVFRPLDIFFIPFLFLWGGCVILWEAKVIHADFFFVLWGIPFALVGLYIVIDRFFVDIKLRLRTFYALTNERILLRTGIFSQHTKTIQLKTLTEMNIQTRADSSGTITFGRNDPLSWKTYRIPIPWLGPERILAPSFDSIENARDVYDLIRRAQGELDNI